ncbi:hypothetical protein KKF34_17310 [Myxococcota bacterium]|nr:hypothetical protein [Myxococcota bacterium]MBU1380295.1 hypothetical protein [Myxococcota bacterium]MBU1498640.1 hypothetical protein [Myxococcota bacterium]
MNIYRAVDEYILTQIVRFLEGAGVWYLRPERVRKAGGQWDKFRQKIDFHSQAVPSREQLRAAVAAMLWDYKYQIEFDWINWYAEGEKNKKNIIDLGCFHETRETAFINVLQIFENGDGSNIRRKDFSAFQDNINALKRLRMSFFEPFYEGHFQGEEFIKGDGKKISPACYLIVMAFYFKNRDFTEFAHLLRYRTKFGGSIPANIKNGDDYEESINFDLYVVDMIDWIRLYEYGMPAESTVTENFLIYENPVGVKIPEIKHDEEWDDIPF